MNAVNAKLKKKYQGMELAMLKAFLLKLFHCYMYSKVSLKLQFRSTATWKITVTELRNSPTAINPQYWVLIMKGSHTSIDLENNKIDKQIKISWLVAIIVNVSIFFLKKSNHVKSKADAWAIKKKNHSLFYYCTHSKIIATYDSALSMSK